MRPAVILRKAPRNAAGKVLPPDLPPFSELAATCGGGLELLLEEEIRNLGYSVLRRRPGVVYFRATLLEVPRCITQLRTASRLLVPVDRSTVNAYDGAYHRILSIPWETIIPPEHTFAITATTRSPVMKDHRFLAMRTKDAIVDRQRGACAGRRSSIDRKTPVFRVVVFVDENKGVEVSLDAGDAPLHERGYRKEAGEAPLRETVAAAMLLQAGYPVRIGEGRPPVLIDPFCGSGTIAIEAALMLAGRAAQLPDRLFAYRRWPWFPPAGETESAPDRSDGEAAPPPVRIFASDRDGEVLDLARRNANRAGVGQMIEFSQGDVRERLPALAGRIRPGRPEVLVVTNPPYGERLDRDDLGALYRDLGTLLKEHMPGGTAHVLCSDRDLMHRTGLRAAGRVPMFNGGIACRLYRLDLR
ncbi:MAG: hypothetical protein EA427_14315 [Spirochaetaceae bacterium]|nr:MAG: hypothetical protein EA427_14315 [Spirochaetaceae bacterium]